MTFLFIGGPLDGRWIEARGRYYKVPIMPEEPDHPTETIYEAVRLSGPSKVYEVYLHSSIHDPINALINGYNPR